LYAAACVLSRLDAVLEKPDAADPHADASFGHAFLAMAYRRISNNFAALDSNDDPAWLDAAKVALGK